MNRRALLMAVLALLAPPPAFGQAAPQPRRVAILEHGDKAARAASWRLFEDRLRETGYIEGRNLVLVRRWTDGVDARLPTLAKELLEGRPELVVVTTTPATQVLMRLTNAVPIVFIGTAEPVEAGLVASLARPGGNVTGISMQLTDVNVKRLSLLHEIVPTAKRVALLGPRNDGVLASLKRLQVAGRTIGVEVHLVEAGDAGTIESAFERLRAHPVDALLVASALVTHYRQIIELTAKFKIPASFIHRDVLEAGALLVFGPDTDALYRRAADFVQQILSGAKPSDLPVEQPRTFWLGVNLKTARALGLRVPESVLLSADRLIE